MRYRTLGALGLALALLLGMGTALAQEQGGSGPTSSAVKLVDLNTATAAELQALPGVGPRIAALVIEYREKNGGFKKIEELMNVRGIGERSFLRLKDLITVTPPEREAAEGSM